MSLLRTHPIAAFEFRAPEVEAFEESEVSVMPEEILDKLTSAQLRELFAYVQSK